MQLLLICAPHRDKWISVDEIIDEKWTIWYLIKLYELYREWNALNILWFNLAETQRAVNSSESSTSKFVFWYSITRFIFFFLFAMTLIAYVSGGIRKKDFCIPTFLSSKTPSIHPHQFLWHERKIPFPTPITTTIQCIACLNFCCV